MPTTKHAYTMLMPYVLAILLAATQTPAGDHASPKTPYVITLRDGTEFVGFWDQRRAFSDKGVEVELDSPWQPGVKRIRTDDVKDAPIRELPQAREERRAKALKAAGLAEVNGKYVSESELRLAERAREMAGVGAKQPANSAPELSPEPAAPETAEAEPAARPGFLSLWGPHIGIVLAAGILIGLISAKFLF